MINSHCLGGTCCVSGLACTVGTKCAILRALCIPADIQGVVHSIASEGYICFISIAKNTDREKMTREETERKLILFAVKVAVFLLHMDCIWDSEEHAKD